MRALAVLCKHWRSRRPRQKSESQVLHRKRAERRRLMKTIWGNYKLALLLYVYAQCSFSPKRTYSRLFGHFAAHGKRKKYCFIIVTETIFAIHFCLIFWDPLMIIFFAFRKEAKYEFFILRKAAKSSTVGRGAPSSAGWANNDKVSGLIAACKSATILSISHNKNTWFSTKALKINKWHGDKNVFEKPTAKNGGHGVHSGFC